MEYENEHKAITRKRFKEIFGVDLDRFLYPGFWAFNIVGFDEWVQPGDGQSLEEAIREKFGEDGVIFVKRRLLASFFIQ